jgi:hypothetical protein
MEVDEIRGRDGFTRDSGRGRYENLSGAISWLTFFCGRSSERQVNSKRLHAAPMWARRREGLWSPALRAMVRAYEPRGRIVFDRSRDHFILYADRKLMTPAMITRIETQFHLPEDRTEIQSDFHYRSTETTIVLET